MAGLASSEYFSNHPRPFGYALTALDHIRLYARHAPDLQSARKICRKALSLRAEAAWLSVDICRRDLLVKIEGVPGG